MKGTITKDTMSFSNHFDVAFIDHEILDDGMVGLVWGDLEKWGLHFDSPSGANQEIKGNEEASRFAGKVWYHFVIPSHYRRTIKRKKGLDAG